jgi:hypothetical protein
MSVYEERRVNVTILAEEGMRVLCSSIIENQPGQARRFRCVRGLVLNGCLTELAPAGTGGSEEPA